MYLINKTNIHDKIEISNPDVLHPTGRYTNLEFTFLSIKPLTKRDKYFEQLVLPTCDEKYWKYDITSNQVIEMNIGEKTIVDNAEALALKIAQLNWLDPNENIRLTADYSLVEVGGILYTFAANMIFRKFNPEYNNVTRKYVVYFSDFVSVTEEESLNSLISSHPEWVSTNMLTIEKLDAIELIIV